MSTTTDVIYTHKKFKRAAAESWESNEAKKIAENKVQPRQSESQSLSTSTTSQNEVKNIVPRTLPNHLSYNGHPFAILDNQIIEDAFVCGRCGFCCNNRDLLNQHVCILSEERIYCSICKQVYKNHTDFQSHECVANNVSYCKQPVEDLVIANQLQKDVPLSVEKSDHVQKGIYNRSHSFPGHNAYKHIEENHFKNISDPVSISSGNKQIYKPKFRAQYSIQEGPSSVQQGITNSNSVLKFGNQETSDSCPTSESMTYHSSTASLFNPGLSQLSIIQGKPLGPFDFRSSKTDEFSLSKGVTSQCSNIWKGIKSPSPELVGQHITNLIVQNQAIVETHNPLWSMKYRRQSSALSSNSESDGGTNPKSRKLSENSRTNKSLQGNLNLSSSHEASFDNHGDSALPTLCSLPRTYFSYPQIQSSSPVRASKHISIPSLSTSSHHKIKNVDNSSPKLSSIHYEYVTAGNTIQKFAAISESTLESLDLSKSSKCKTEVYFHCNKCGNLIHGNETREQHLKYCHQYLYNHDKVSEGSSKIMESRRLDEQEVALDLHKKKERPTFIHDRSSSRESIIEPVFKPLQVEDNVNHPTTMFSRSFGTSPPVKRKKVIPDYCSQEKTYTPLYPQNGRINKSDYGMKMFDDFGKPRGNIHHLYGGEVQICDGKEMKTLKIDSIQNETPSLDLCIASKHFGVDLNSRENQVPTSVVVTIAKCGLNSGGTMVKVDNQSSSNYAKRKLDVDIVNVQNNNNNSFNSKSQSEKIINLSSQPVGRIISPIGIHPSLIQYKTDVSGSSSENMTAVSLKLFKGPAPTFSVLPKIQSTPNSLSESIGVQGFVQKSSVSPLGYKNSNSETVQNDVPSHFPSVISIGDQLINHVPGMPGPHTEEKIILKSPNTRKPLLLPICNSDFLPNKSMKLPKTTSPSPSSSSNSSLSILNNASINSSTTILAQSVEQNKSLEFLSGSLIPPKVPGKYLSVINTMTKPPEIRIHPVADDTAGPSKPKIDEHKMKNENGNKDEITDDDNTFLMPRKRPNTLVIKPQAFSVKPSLSLIGSTLVSPDTPRPKKSCAQLFLNGSAYTYLNLKVSTKTFFCCIYRPQPMYVVQSPKLSMYSNWQIRKTENPLNISPSEAMSLHVSSFYHNKAYTIAKPKILQLKVTDSSYWTQNDKSGKMSVLNITSNIAKIDEEKYERTSESRRIKNKEGTNNIPAPKRIKIFEGGFKTNEDYTYVRGRGRGRYVCETCGIRCKKPSMLKKHIRTHTDLRPFACKHCSFSFKTKGNLTKHLKSKAHFKRCTEMGIVPVPVTVNESHVNQKAVHLQGMIDHGKDSVQNMNDEDDDEDDEEDDDEEEEEDDDEEEDEDDDYDDEDEESSSTLRQGKLKPDFSVSDLMLGSSVYLNPSTTSDGNSLAAHSHNEFSGIHCGSSSNSSSYSESSVRTFKIDGNVDDTTPMDLSIKRPSVITTFSHHEMSIGSQVARPDHLPLPKKINHDGRKPPIATTPIKEQAKDILSPVTESSLLLKSIYNTTLKVSSSNLEKRNSNSDPMKDTSCGAMLQTYLTERAVLDSTRKRYQYLQSSSEEQSLVNDIPSTSITYSSLQSRSPGPPISQSSSYSPRRSIATDSPAPFPPPPPLPSSAESKASSEPTSITQVPIIASTKQVLSTATNISSSSTPSQSSQLVKSSHCKTSITVPVTVSTVTSAVSSGGSTVFTSSAKTVSDVRVNRSGRRSAKNNSTALLLSTSNPMPTSPANLTVINSCSGDSKTAFIAPSGVLPSPHNNRLGSDDGKCKCSVCHKEFAKQGQLRLHINIHYIERPHRCESCGISFRTNGHLQKHKRSVSHFNKVNMNMTFGTPSTDNPRPFKCHDCKIAFRIYGHLAKHLRSKLHIMKLECLGKLPFGTYAEIERSGVNLNEIDTSDCENSLESLQLMASKLYEKEPAKLLAWQSQQQQQQQQQKKHTERERTISSSSNNSEEYSLMDEQECGTPSSASTGKSNEEEESGDEDDPPEVKSLDTSSTSSSPPVPPPHSSSLPPCEVGSGSTEGLIGCPKCHRKFMDLKHFEIHHFSEHENSVSKENEDEMVVQAKNGGCSSPPSNQSSNDPHHHPHPPPPSSSPSSDVIRL